MLYFYTLLTSGAKLSRLPRSFLPQVEHLLSLGVLKQKEKSQDTEVILQAPFILAIVQEVIRGDSAGSSKERIFAKSLDPKHSDDFLIQCGDFSHDKGSKRGRKSKATSHNAPAKPKKGDIILAIQTRGKNRGIKAKGQQKLRAKMLEILHASKPYALAVLALDSEIRHTSESTRKKPHKKHDKIKKNKGGDKDGDKKDKSGDKILALMLQSKKKPSERDCLLNLKASQKSLRALPRHCVVKVELSSGEIVEVLGSLEDAHIDEALALSGTDRGEFSQEALDFAAAFGQSVEPLMYPGREDLRHLDFCVIDPSDAKDHDDAIYFDHQAQTLYVAIADVSEYVSQNSALDKEARQRGFSLYFPHKVLPMLPHALSSGICSLKEGEPRLAMVWQITLNQNAQVTNSRLCEAIICSKANVSYEEVQSFLDSGSSESIPQGVAEWLKGYVPFVRRLKEERLKNACEFENSQIRLTLDENAHITSWHKESQDLAHSVIEESMLLANIQAATMLELARTKGQIAQGFYRIHPHPKERRLDELLFMLHSLGLGTKGLDMAELQNLESREAIVKIQSLCATLTPYMRDLIDTLIIKSLAKATYSTQNIGHFGLGFRLYTHFTSPIRRYGDLIIHRILKALLREDTQESHKHLAFITQDLHAIAQEINLKERQIAHIEQQFFSLKIIRLCVTLLELAQTRGEELIIQAAMLDECLALALEAIPQARIHLQKTPPEHISPLSLVYVRIERVDLLRGHIYGEVVKSCLDSEILEQSKAPQSPKEER